MLKVPCIYLCAFIDAVFEDRPMPRFWFLVNTVTPLPLARQSRERGGRDTGEGVTCSKRKVCAGSDKGLPFFGKAWRVSYPYRKEMAVKGRLVEVYVPEFARKLGTCETFGGGWP